MVPKHRRLLPRQILFAEYCLTESSAARAAIRAGYAPASARNQAYRLLRKDDIRRRIEGGLTHMCARDRARRERLLENCARLFDAAMAAGRLEPALGALNAETALSGLRVRAARASPAQQAQEAKAPDPSDDIGPEPRVKL